MTYRIRLTSLAQTELVNAAVWWAEHRSPDQAIRWLDGFEEALNSLAQQPDKHSLARENNQFAFPLYQLHYGVARKPTHRAVFRITGDTVEILTIRHLAQRDLRPGDF
jgi:plasmid stabilization system protein ParE